jgi:predicted N-acyltransferase
VTPAQELDLDLATDLASVDRQAWDLLVGPDNPFLEYGFLRTLETAGCVGEATAWHPRYLLARRQGRLVGAVPFYVKWDSYGEFIFDWQWAEAWRRAGLSYYPKITVAAPFTPVGGDRLLVAPEERWEEVAGALVDALLATAAAEGISGVHVLFPDRRQHVFLASRGLMARVSHQYHWENPGYGGFDDFLAALRSSKRKQIRKERRQVEDSGLRIRTLAGDEIRPAHMDAMWQFYGDTVARKWSQAYLTREAFDGFLDGCRDRLLLVLAFDGERPVAGTLNFFKGSHVFGRYWGALVDVPSLHFECCFYRLMEFAIERGLRVVEAGAQGEHKFLRGFAARPTYSNHWIAHDGARRAVEAFLRDESAHEQAVIEGYNSVSPLKEERREAAASHKRAAPR